ncbi:MAG: flagellar basal body P-ring protein FlgI [Planctomycetota bacterium]
MISLARTKPASHDSKPAKLFRVFFVAMSVLFSASLNAAGLRLGEVCRVKGQETNSLQGLGLVVGLKGTGDGDSLPTSRALAEMMRKMGGPMSVDMNGQLNVQDVADAKNVAMVFVTASIPSTGAQGGDQINVQVNAISAKSLEGGTLLQTPLLGPRPDNPVVYASASGPIQIDTLSTPTGGTIVGGGKMEASVPMRFVKDNQITLVLDSDFASFDNAHRIEEEINGLSALAVGGTFESESLENDGKFARAIDQLHIEVELPSLYSDNPIKFISLLFDTIVPINSRSNRVVINEREGIVVIGKDVELAPVVISHRQMQIDAGASSLVAVGGENDPAGNAKLKDLADALNALNVPTDDLIHIIKILKAKGDLFGEVIYE